MTDTERKSSKKPRGFAAMDPEKQREIARRGGKIAHLRGNAHEFTPEEAREAGRKGGQSVSRDRKHMAEIGRLGGEARSQSRGTSGRGESQAPSEV
jgi:general stress protein YciG